MAEQAHKVDYAEGPAAVQDYLDFMLREATELEPERETEREPEETPRPEPRPVVEQEPAPEPEPELEAESHPVPAEKADPRPDDGPEPTTAYEVEEVVAPEPAEAHRVPPEWAKEEFPSLLFRVRGMDMAAPLIHLGGIANVSDDTLQPVAGQAPWFIGLMRWNGRTIRVIDTARLLVGEKADEMAPPDGGRRRGYESVVVLHGTDWGLAIDGPGESRRLEPGDIRWRHQRGGRPWLAGTLSGRLCSLLDTEAIIGRLAPIAPVSRPDNDAPSLAQNLQEQG